MIERNSVGQSFRYGDAALIIGIPALVTLLAAYTKSFWGDEILSISYASQSGFGIFTILAGDYHPPLYFLALKAWILVFGTGELGLRLFQGLQGTAFIWVSLILFRKAFPGRRYHPFWFLLICSSEFWLFMPMLRYYTLAATLVIVSTILFWKWMDEANSGNGALLGLSYIAILYTDYPSSIVILFQLVYVLVSYRRVLIRHLLVLISVLIAFLPWMLITYDQIMKLRSLGQVADLNTSPFAVLLKCGYSLYAFLMGETAYPFEILTGLCLLIIIVVSGIGLAAMKVRGNQFVIYSAGLVITGILFTSLLTTYISTHTSFIYTPSRTFFGLAFLFMGMGFVYDSLKIPWLQYLLLLAFAFEIGYGDINWYSNKHFLMPVYATPWKEVMRDLNNQNGVIFTDESLCYAYYHEQLAGSYPNLVSSSRGIEVLDSLRKTSSQSIGHDAIFVLRQGRESTESEITPEFLTYLEQHGALEFQKKYLLIDTAYRSIKEKILHRDSYDAKITLYKYVLKDK